MRYADFLATKVWRAPDSGMEIAPEDLHVSLFDFQRHVTAWAVRKGRAALLLDTGLGKTRCQVEWARAIGERTLILAPLAVAYQTVREAEHLGVDVTYARNASESPAHGITITNYERLHLFDPAAYPAVVLDESSILKAFSGTVKRQLVRSFKHTPYRLACTATPAPNDVEELCNHADFLGVMSPQEMRSTFFIAANRGEFMRYRLKGHAGEAFHRWMASWAMALRHPSDLGFQTEGFDLPPLDVREHVVTADWRPSDRLFATEMKGVTERANVRRATLEARVDVAIDLVNAEPAEQHLVWCGMNEEGRRVAKGVPDAVVVEGSDTPDAKAEALWAFACGDVRVLITKAQIAGYGLNFQGCSRMTFVGLNDSFEQYYQAVRRCWRYGQTRPVVANVVISDVEQQIYANVLAKQAQHEATAAGLLRGLLDHERHELFAGTSKGDVYEPTMTAEVPAWMQ